MRCVRADRDGHSPRDLWFVLLLLLDLVAAIIRRKAPARGHQLKAATASVFACWLVLLGVDLPLALVGFVWTTLPSVRVQPRLSCVPIQRFREGTSSLTDTRIPFLLFLKNTIYIDADIQNHIFLLLHRNIVAVI